MRRHLSHSLKNSYHATISYKSEPNQVSKKISYTIATMKNKEVETAKP